MEYALDWMQQSIVKSAYEQVVFNMRQLCIFSACGMAKLLPELNINKSHDVNFLIQIFHLFLFLLCFVWKYFFHSSNKNKQTVYYDSIIIRLLRKP